MTSVRAWACPKMFARVVGFRRSAGLCDEIIHLYPWGGHKRPTCFRTKVIPVPVEWWKPCFGGDFNGEVCAIVFLLEWCRILGRGGTGPASKSDWQVKTRAKIGVGGWGRKKSLRCTFRLNSNGFPLSSHMKVLGWFDGSRLLLV